MWVKILIIGHLLMCFVCFKVNTFQAVLITDGVNSYIKFNYPADGIQWVAPYGEMLEGS